MGFFDFFKSSDKNTLNVDSINDAFLLGNKFQSDGDHNKAINIYTTVLNLIIKSDSENTEIQGSNFIEKNIEKGEVSIIPIDGVYFNLGSSYNVLKLYDKAKEAFEQAIKVNKDADALIHHYLGCAKIYLRDFSTSIADFNNALKKDPDYSDSYYMRAVAYASDECEFKNLEKALSDVKKYLEYEPKDKAGNDLLTALEANKDSQSFMRISKNVFCSNCGAKQKENKFCMNCGNKM
jgi:tetratricopeptide (TPR) repeat protein